MDRPVGNGNHTVEQGECLSSIAVNAGHHWQKLWDLPENQELKDTREDPNALLPGDKVEVPEIEEKEESRGCNARHSFRRLGVPSKIKVRCLYFGEPLANCDYRLDIDGESAGSGQTDDQGMVEVSVPPEASDGLILVTDEDGNEHEIGFKIGDLDPIGTVSGVKGRLQNIGYFNDEVNAEETPEYESALRRFQEDQGLEPTGEADDATRERLVDLGG